MTQSVPNYASCEGGLVLNSNKFDLLRRPGAALKLLNFEVSLSGGYRRVNGFVKFGGSSSTQPNGSNPVLGLHPYALGVVACVGTNVYYSEDGISWTLVNKDTGESGDTEGNLSALSTLARSNAGQTSFVLAKGTIDHATNPYGVLYIASGNDSIGHFHIDGTGGSRTFTYTEISTPSAGEILEDHDHHLCVIDSTNAPNEVYYSAVDEYDDFEGGTSGKIRLSDVVVGLKSFRRELYIFCQNSIHKLININDPATQQIVPVTGNLGCLSGKSIQEIGGDLVFLGPDGFRSVAATARNEDIERSSISRNIQPLINTVIANKSQFTFSSVVLSNKSQYRFFYVNSTGVSKGFIGTLKGGPQGGSQFEWSTVSDISAYSINSNFNQDEVETTYHGGFDGYIYLHDTGSSFDGSDIIAVYQSPDTDLGDLGLRKTLNYLNLSFTPEGVSAVTLNVTFDFNSPSVSQPAPFSVTIATAPAKYNSGTYGNSKYGSTADPLKRIPLHGSGNSIAYRFTTTDTNPSYTIQGFHTEIFPSGRK